MSDATKTTIRKNRPTFVEAGKWRINLNAIALVEYGDGFLTLYFTGSDTKLSPLKITDPDEVKRLKAAIDFHTPFHV